MRSSDDSLGPLRTLSEQALAKPARRRDDGEVLALRIEIEAQRREVARLLGLVTGRTVEGRDAAKGSGRVARRLYRLKDLTEEFGLSRSTIYKWMQDGRFPAQVRLGGRLSRWRGEDVESWLAEAGELIRKGNVAPARQGRRDVKKS